VHLLDLQPSQLPKRRDFWQQWGKFRLTLRFTDNQIYLQETEGFDQVRHSQKHVPSVPNMITYRDCVFVVCPKLNTEFHKEHKKSLLYYKKLKKTEQMTEKQKQLKK
jgi:hypothetical protein